MALPTESFKLITPSHVLLHFRDWELALPNLVDPAVADSLVYGEYLTPFVSAGKLARETAGGGALGWVFYDQKGAYDLQFHQGRKVPVIQHGSFMADTWLFDRTGITVLGHTLTAKLITIDAVDRSILTDAAGAEKILGYIVKLPGSATAPLRYLGDW